MDNFNKIGYLAIVSIFMIQKADNSTFRYC